MEAYIKSFATFRTLHQRSVTSYDLIIDALDDQLSAITVVGDDLPGTLANSWMVFDGVPMRIDTVTPDKGVTKFSLQRADSIFNRQLVYVENGDTTIGGFIERIVTAEWINQTDGAFATPYLVVNNLDDTPFIAPKPDENGIYNFLAYIQAARQNYNISTQFAVDRNHLIMTIRRDQSKTHPLVLGDGHTQLASSSFAASNVTKITVIQPVKIEPEETEEPEESEESDEEQEDQFKITQTEWYLSKDGIASTTVPANRADGDWITIVLGENDDQAEKVQEEFSKNGESHKVEIYSDTNMAVNDRFRIRLNGELFDGTIIRKSRRMGDSRVLYTSGELITTIQERVHNAVAQQSNSYTGDGSGQMYAVGDIFITTRQGNPSSLLGYGAWEQIQGRFLFAADSSHAVKSRGGNAEHTITTAELPEIEIPIKSGGMSFGAERSNATSGTNWWVMRGNITGASVTIPGESQPFSIMPPYISVYVWLRKE